MNLNTTVAKWRLRRFAAWFIPLVVFMVLFLSMNTGYRAATGERAFASDHAYRHLVVAESLQNNGYYSAYQSGPIPLVHDGLWRMLLASVDVFIQDLITSTLFLGLTFSALTLLIYLKIANRMFTYPLFGYSVATLLVLVPGLLAAGLSGLNVALCMCLISTAMLRHLASLEYTGDGLPFSSVVMIGLAMWLRVEFGLVWLVLGAHTLLLAYLPKEDRLQPCAVLLRIVNGILYLALFMLPLAWWNLQVVGVPWPRMTDVPLALSIWGMYTPFEAFSLTWSNVVTGTGQAFGAYMRYTLPHSIIPRIFFLTGVALVVWRCFTAKEGRTFLFLLLPPLLIPMAGLLYPYSGAEGFRPLFNAFAPTTWLLVAYGYTYLPIKLERFITTKWNPPWSMNRISVVWWSGIGVILLLVSMLALAREHRHNREQVAHQMNERRAIEQLIDEHGLSRDTFLTDQPGWLVWQLRLEVMDVEGEWSPRILTVLNMDGGFNRLRFSELLSAQKSPVSVVLLWDEHPGLPVASVLEEPEMLIQRDDDDATRGRPLLLIERNARAVL